MGAKILWVEGKRAGGPDFISKLREKGYGVDTVPTGKAALKHFHQVDPDLVVVDAASLRTSGARICSALNEEGEGIPIVLILDAEREIAKNSDANVVLQHPFTIRKLVNRIVALLPGGGERVMSAGSIRLDLERRQVKCGSRETHLTPRMTRLLRMLMDHSGEVVERKFLFRRVWKTEYTGDTRTLDVHISWLRRAIEEDPRRPKRLKTIRGIGYRLDV